METEFLINAVLVLNFNTNLISCSDVYFTLLLFYSVYACGILMH